MVIQNVQIGSGAGKVKDRKAEEHAHNLLVFSNICLCRFSWSPPDGRAGGQCSMFSRTFRAEIMYIFPSIQTLYISPPKYTEPYRHRIFAGDVYYRWLYIRGSILAYLMR